tara:strand:- start:937 stop:1092 length:156 start_codon:yes stop_codon:yes gene_type:complete
MLRRFVMLERYCIVHQDHHIESAMVVMAETIIKAKSVCVFLREIYKVWKGQ